jgi:electron transport complex protein RnfE
MHLLFGELAQGWTVTLFADYPGFLVAILPPGAFIITGFLIALKNTIDHQQAQRAAALKAKPVKGSKRVRTTGSIA